MNPAMRVRSKEKRDNGIWTQVCLLILIVILGTVLHLICLEETSFGYPILVGNVSIHHMVSSKWFRFKEKTFDCPRIMQRMRDRPPASDWPPPRKIPKELYDAFTQDGLLRVTSWYWAQKYSGDKAAVSVWDNKLISAMSGEFARGDYSRASYDKLGVDRLRDIFDRFSVSKKHVMVVGSERPWVELLALQDGADQVTTLEYGEINCTASRMEAFVPSHYAQIWLDADDGLEVDAIVSYCSYGHAGLGRYGDALDPDGDIAASEETWCMVRPGGYFYLALPWGNRSQIVWNAHRIYGPERLELFAAGWKQVYWEVPWGDDYGVLVLRKPR